MNTISPNTIIFPFEWTVKSTAYKIKVRTASDITEVDDSFCNIINSKGGEIRFDEFAKILGFNLDDIAEKDVYEVYLNKLQEYNLINYKPELIKLTSYGKESLISRLKYKYSHANVNLFENQNAEGEEIDFSFKDTFGIYDEPKAINRQLDFRPIKKTTVLSKLQFQIYNNNIYKGDVVEVSNYIDPKFSYRTFILKCKITFYDNNTQINFYKDDIGLTSLDQLLKNSQNEIIKEELIRLGKFHLILSNQDKITPQNLRIYSDICDWNALVINPKIDWNDSEIFELFKIHGDASIWEQLSENISIDKIKAVINNCEDFFNWTVLSRRLDNSFIKENIQRFNWDFEELSYRESDFVMDLLPISGVNEHGWDWNFLSQTLPDEFIEENIFKFDWDFHIITTLKNEVFKNVFRKHNHNPQIIFDKGWDWKYISQEINIKFLQKNIKGLASKVEWATVIKRFFNDEKIIDICLKDESFKFLLKENLPGNYRVSDQKYLWSLKLIDFFEELQVINWETNNYINGIDTNEGVEWDRETFTKYYHKITTENGYANVSKHITDAELIEDFPDFIWDWEAISTNKFLINDRNFIDIAISGIVFQTDKLYWGVIFSQSTYDVSYWNKKLQAFCSKTNSDSQYLFWELLTRQENAEFIFSNQHFPWDWTYVTKTLSEEKILESLKDEGLVKKLDWEIVTRKIDKNTILQNLEDLSNIIDWSYLIKELFSIDNELQLENQLPRIASCLFTLEEGKRMEYWKELTATYPFPQLYEYVKETYRLKEFEWDWDRISAHDHFPNDLQTLNRFKTKLNWTIFSGSKAIFKKFDFNEWDSFNDWFVSTNKYLLRFSGYWDWKVLSRIKDLTYNGAIIEKFKEEDWDWQYLSEFGGFLKNPKKDEDLLNNIKQFPKIEFGFLSKRTDIEFDNYLIFSTKDKDWDWQELSKNRKAKLSSDLLLELKDKNWNWKLISARPDLNISNNTLLSLINKDWDWQVLSKNPDLEFNPEFIGNTKFKPWSWEWVSRHKTFVPNMETLILSKDYDLDWIFISNNSSLNPTKKLLSKFEDKWDWWSITRNDKLDFSDSDFLERFIDRWDWSFICNYGKLRLDYETLNKFKKHLDWDLISVNTSIDFTQSTIQEFRPYWNWSFLRYNKRVEELLGDYVVREIEDSPMLSFLYKINQLDSSWKGSVYHFTHIDNAVEIIKNRKIQSRNIAAIKGDAAGNVVHRRGDAHDYARFYFRPKTPTQFYNEFLGKNTNAGYISNNVIVSWYEKARGLGFPKCPIPIFFRFSLKEVLFQNEKKCCISNGNMQTSSTCFGNIDTMINKFGFRDLYYTPPAEYGTKEDYTRYRNNSQQEFLVKDELSFHDFVDFEIVCPSDADRNLLINLLGSEQNDVFSKIVVNDDYYNFQNPRIKVEEDESEISISTNFHGDGYFVLKGSQNMGEIKVISGKINSMDDEKIIFESNITISNKMEQDITLRFIDESNRNWFVYSKKYSVKKHLEAIH